MIPEFQKARLASPVHILLSYDEETTCRGPLDTIARFGADLPRPGAVLVGEPTSMQVADAHKSVAAYATIVHGHEAHSSKPSLGASAVEAACDLVTELYRFGEEFAARGDPSGRFDPPASTVHVGTIHGGTARNIMAKLCSFRWEFRALPGVEQNLALRRLEDYAARVVTPKLTRHAKDAFIETLTEVEVPGLKPENGSIAETLALKARAVEAHDRRAFRLRGRPVSIGQRAGGGLRSRLDRPGASAGRIYRDRADRGLHRLHAQAGRRVELNFFERGTFFNGEIHYSISCLHRYSGRPR